MSMYYIMPIFYHIHRGADTNSLDDGFIDGEPLWFSKKDSYWYKVEKIVGCTNYGGYKTYEIFIPSEAYTTSMHPRTPKIIKITSETINDFKKIWDGHNATIALFKKRGAIGVDCTDHYGVYRNPPEGIIWKLPPKAYIKLVEVKVCDEEI